MSTLSVSAPCFRVCPGTPAGYLHLMIQTYSIHIIVLTPHTPTVRFIPRQLSRRIMGLGVSCPPIPICVCPVHTLYLYAEAPFGYFLLPYSRTYNHCVSTCVDLYCVLHSVYPVTCKDKPSRSCATSSPAALSYRTSHKAS